jgi:hypothetical protein
MRQATHHDDAENVKDHYNGATAHGLGGEARLSATHGRVIVRTGHSALDAALANDRSVAPDLSTLKAACRPGPEFTPAPITEGLAVTAGQLADTMSLTPDRDGAGTTMHVASRHAVVDRSGRRREIRVWHELATHGCN